MDFDFYQDAAAGTDQFAGKNAKKDAGLMIPLLGIAGETGTLLAEFKKKIEVQPIFGPVGCLVY